MFGILCQIWSLKTLACAVLSLLKRSDVYADQCVYYVEQKAGTYLSIIVCNARIHFWLFENQNYLSTVMFKLTCKQANVSK